MKPYFVSNSRMGTLLVIAFLIVLLYKPILEAYDDYSTPQPWFAAAFDVPSYEAGQDPLIAYHLTVNRPVHGVWTSSVYRQEDKSTVSLVCSGGGYAYYHKDANGTMLMPLSRFIGASCDISKGEYRICTNYDLEDDRGIDRSFGPFCDFFNVQ